MRSRRGVQKSQLSSYGSSGSPVLGMDGKAVGMLTHIGIINEYGDIDSFSYAVNLAGERIP